MPVLPEEITATTLRRQWRGYRRGQVETLLGRVGADYAGALDRLALVAEDGDRARKGQERLQRSLDALTDTTHEDDTRARATADADAIQARADRAAELIITQAEAAAAACDRQAQALRESAQADADAARQRLEEADRRARQLEDAARDRCDAVRTETETRLEQLQTAERHFADRIRQVENTLGALRSQVGLLDHVQHAEQALAALRTDTHTIPWSTGAGAPTNGHHT
ncbi:DivIVA domain-containing protein [Kribbella aluminosa]|uniref:DivIVA domain-containing protein n=1 Tax=Kribbella aluminosa TaxID=416017 RepID=A0ABS4UBQ1_9ACTN|nr:DivIVA domain-containing protein [Kribbella aluminosa]MBP2349014.1 DivIVA domain-containing protein [Kribbella aluminosa]